MVGRGRRVHLRRSKRLRQRLRQHAAAPLLELLRQLAEDGGRLRSSALRNKASNVSQRRLGREQQAAKAALEPAWRRFGNAWQGVE